MRCSTQQRTDSESWRKNEKSALIVGMNDGAAHPSWFAADQPRFVGWFSLSERDSRLVETKYDSMSESLPHYTIYYGIPHAEAISITYTTGHQNIDLISTHLNYQMNATKLSALLHTDSLAHPLRCFSPVFSPLPRDQISSIQILSSGVFSLHAT